MKLNLPNRLTLLRLVLIPLCMAVIVFPVFPGDIIWRIVAAAIFALTAFTDFLDGYIARKYKLITNFGKFLDPLADKLLVFGAMLALIIRFSDSKTFAMVYMWAAFIVIFREVAVTSLRMIASQSEGLVIAAGWLGKVKTTLQMLCILTVILEGIFSPAFVASYILTAAMTVMTIWSGLSYFKAYLPVIALDK